MTILTAWTFNKQQKRFSNSYFLFVLGGNNFAKNEKEIFVWGNWIFTLWFCLLYYPRNHRRLGGAWSREHWNRRRQTGKKEKEFLFSSCLFGVILRGYNRAQCHNVEVMYQLMSSRAWLFLDLHERSIHRQIMCRTAYLFSFPFL